MDSDEMSEWALHGTGRGSAFLGRNDSRVAKSSEPAQEESEDDIVIVDGSDDDDEGEPEIFKARPEAELSGQLVNGLVNANDTEVENSAEGKGAQIERQEHEVITTIDDDEEQGKPRRRRRRNKLKSRRALPPPAFREPLPLRKTDGKPPQFHDTNTSLLETHGRSFFIKSGLLSSTRRQSTDKTQLPPELIQRFNPVVRISRYIPPMLCTNTTQASECSSVAEVLINDDSEANARTGSSIAEIVAGSSKPKSNQAPPITLPRGLSVGHSKKHMPPPAVVNIPKQIFPPGVSHLPKQVPHQSYIPSMLCNNTTQGSECSSVFLYRNASSVTDSSGPAAQEESDDDIMIVDCSDDDDDEGEPEIFKARFAAELFGQLENGLVSANDNEGDNSAEGEGEEIEEEETEESQEYWYTHKVDDDDEQGKPRKPPPNLNCLRCLQKKESVFTDVDKFWVHVDRHVMEDHYVCVTCKQPFVKLSHCLSHEYRVHGTPIPKAYDNEKDKVIAKAKQYVNSLKEGDHPNLRDVDPEDVEFYENRFHCSGTYFPYRGPVIQNWIECYEIEHFSKRSKCKSINVNPIAKMAIQQHRDNVDKGFDKYKLGRFQGPKTYKGNAGPAATVRASKATTSKPKSGAAVSRKRTREAVSNRDAGARRKPKERKNSKL